MWVGNTTDDGVDVALLVLFRDAVLGDNEGSRLLEHVVDDITNFLIGQCIGNHFLVVFVAVVGSGCVTGVDGVELAFDVGLEVVDPVDGGDIGVANGAEGSFFNNPFVELFDADVQAAVSRLVGDDTVNGRVGKLGTIVEGRDTRAIGVVLDVTMQGVSSTDGILTSNDGHGIGRSASIDSLGNDRGDEFEHIRAHGTSDNVGGGDLLDHITLMGLGVESTVVSDGLGDLTLLANLGDLVGGSVLQRGDDIVHDINEDHLVAGLMEELSNEATADVTTAELDSLLSHVVRCMYQRESRRVVDGEIVKKRRAIESRGWTVMRVMRMRMEDEMERQPVMGEMEVFIVRGKKKKKRRKENKMEAKRRKPDAGSRDRAGEGKSGG